MTLGRMFTRDPNVQDAVGVVFFFFFPISLKKRGKSQVYIKALDCCLLFNACFSTWTLNREPRDLKTVSCCLEAQLRQIVQTGFDVWILPSCSHHAFLISFVNK